MTAGAYYNEIDPYASQWLRNLIAAGHIADGDVDERSIVEVQTDDIRGYRQCHFFAGIGGWLLAIRLAGFPDGRSVWTGSCPCQPFSAAGKKGAGFADERHLWPEWFRLIDACRPPVVFGEQVASPAGLAWFDLVSADLENAGYAVEAADICAAGIGAPHIRQRLWFVADTDDARSQRRGERGDGADQCAPGPDGLAGRMADADGRDAGAKGLQRSGQHGQQPQDSSAGDDRRPGPVNGLWRDADWLFCRDGKWRPIEPGIEPLVTGVSGRVELVRAVKQAEATVQETHRYSRVGALRGYGNAIVPQVAAEFIGSWLDCQP